MQYAHQNVIKFCLHYLMEQWFLGMVNPVFLTKAVDFSMLNTTDHDQAIIFYWGIISFLVETTSI